ncbi:molybdenum cofactor guanylyltransferase MobA [Ferribacterium limneticum]|uniref:molybdenum cofactor guanylyltransferase MobA n=1 Tax=Ferribacterium limneticum TaxID=76259 RepID=UPI001CFA46D7|nr:molybdenum cofactor guanylyltransferase MobA [Ferribacterium limneticum]UCV28198.1 molybdenum cofactor guanylyltransferase [Ferribacterium limneticum]UCV32115.1 molybdenum cofactor guanylyltransferase [Ferribacterium limneticum]
MPTAKPRFSRPSTPSITGVVLAGGLGRRMGGVDKGLQLLDGRPLVRHVTERLAPQVDRLMINANRSQEQYAALAYPLIADVISGFAGPLAGLHAALTAAETPLVATVPCDSPYLPLDLIERLYAGLQSQGADIAIASAGGRIHPVFCLCRTALRDKLEGYLQSGGRKVALWCAEMRGIEVDFSDQPEAFSNFNTLADLQKS